MMLNLTQHVATPAQVNQGVMEPSLVNELKGAGIQPLFAYSDRVSVDVQNPDGSVSKTVKFEHLGFVKA